jgi:hypothetical protein
MNRPVRTTIVFGAISALVLMPLAGGLAGLIGWTLAVKLMLWADLLFYALLLARWSGKGPGPIVFPLALLLGTALWPGFTAAFFFLGLGVFSWIRSGICFGGTPLRAIAAEIVTVAGGAGLVTLLGTGSTVTLAISIWLFFLVQALYFFIVPAIDPQADDRPAADPFAQAHREALRVLDEAG